MQNDRMTPPSLEQRRQFKYDRAEGVSHSPRYAIGGWGEPIVFLPGLAGMQITGIHHDLAERFRLVVFDIPRLRDACADGATVTRDVAHLVGRSLDLLGIPSFHLQGSGYGASVALQLALQAPERVSSLILAAPTVLRPEHRGADGQLAPSGDPSFGAEIEKQLAAIQIPTLVLFGADDIVVPPATGALYEEELPNCRFLLVEDAGNAVEDDQPAFFIRTVSDFVADPRKFVG
jgi:pimeloyl-ACP methyl ester carboxylesterase